MNLRAMWPTADKYGECVVTRMDDFEGPKLWVNRADPIVRIAPELLAEVPHPSSDGDWPATFDGKVLRIQAVNRTVVYRIRDALEPRPGAHGCWDYVGEWPD